MLGFAALTANLRTANLRHGRIHSQDIRH
jgi:hypothetical protein